MLMLLLTQDHIFAVLQTTTALLAGWQVNKSIHGRWKPDPINSSLTTTKSKWRKWPVEWRGTRSCIQQTISNNMHKKQPRYKYRGMYIELVRWTRLRYVVCLTTCSATPGHTAISVATAAKTSWSWRQALDRRSRAPCLCASSTQVGCDDED